MWRRLWTRLRFSFFQAADGIRHLTVTGVQTCALPIFRGYYERLGFVAPVLEAEPLVVAADAWAVAPAVERSEERRVGKEFSREPAGGVRQQPRHDRERRAGARDSNVLSIARTTCYIRY